MSENEFITFKGVSFLNLCELERPKKVICINKYKTNVVFTTYSDLIVSGNIKVEDYFFYIIERCKDYDSNMEQLNNIRFCDR